MTMEEDRRLQNKGWAILRPPERLKPSDWVSRHFRHGPQAEIFDFERFPWLKEPIDCAADYRVAEQLLIAPPQVGKSLAAEAIICQKIVEDPADIVAYTHTQEMADDWGEKRIIPSIRRCRPSSKLLPTEPSTARMGTSRGPRISINHESNPAYHAISRFVINT